MRSFPGMRQIPFEDRARYSAAFFLEHYFPKSDRVKGLKAATRDRIVRHIQAGGKGNVIQVERVKKLNPEDFRKHFLAKGIPVHIEGGAADWPLIKRWTFENLRERFGHETIKLVQRKGLSDDDFIDEREFSEEIGFGAFLDQVLSGGRKYMRFSPLLEKFPELLGDFDHTFFERMISNPFGTGFQLFIGGKGTFTPLHNAITPFFFLNVSGIKRWALIPSHYLAVLNPAADGFGYNHSEAELDFSNVDAFPGLDCIDRMEAVMQGGDLLYVPSWMWHCVQNESPTIGVRCGFLYPQGMVRESATLAAIRLFAARNPNTLEWIYYSFIKTNLPERDRLLITPKWWLGRKQPGV
jgi:hypothetical protein